MSHGEGGAPPLNADDLLEIEQLQFYYEQAYSIHRHKDLPHLFCRGGDTLLDIGGDTTLGHGAIVEKFDELALVSPREDAYHTGWQVCVPLIDICDETGKGRILAPTFGYLVLNLAAELFQPPYTVNAAVTLWDNTLRREGGRWRLAALRARFMLAQPVWRWDAERDDSTATRFEMGTICHPFPVDRYKEAGEDRR